MARCRARSGTLILPILAHAGMNEFANLIALVKASKLQPEFLYLSFRADHGRFGSSCCKRPLHSFENRPTTRPGKSVNAI
jgi:hypothetical protein